MKTVTRIWLGLLMIVLSAPMNGQGLFNVAFRPSASVPLKELGSTNLKKGGGFEATFSYQFIRGFTMYGGWGWNTFLPEEDLEPFDHIEETGYRFGLQRIQPLSKESKLNFLLSAGAVLNHIESENDEGDIIDDSGHGIGWEADLAISIPLNEKWQIAPGVRYHSLSRELITDGLSQPVDLNYIAIGVAVSWTLVQK
jgi:hypothetical protein